MSRISRAPSAVFLGRSPFRRIWLSILTVKHRLLIEIKTRRMNYLCPQNAGAGEVSSCQAAAELTHASQMKYIGEHALCSETGPFKLDRTKDGVFGEAAVPATCSSSSSHSP